MGCQAVRGNASPSAIGEDHTSHYLKQYRFAQKVGDLNAAATALVGYLAENDDPAYLDTLMQIYILTGNNPSALAAGYILLEKGHASNTLLDRLAVIEKNVGLLDSAIVRYLTLYQKTADPVYAYELAGIYFQKQDFTSMEKQLDRIFNDPKAHQRKVSIIIQQQPQEIPLLAAAYNLRGYYFLNKGDIDKAEADFQQALKAAPQFPLPQNNLMLIQQVRQRLQQQEGNAEPEKK